MDKRNQAAQPDPRKQSATRREETGEFQQTEDTDNYDLDQEDEEELEYDEELDENSEAEEDEENP